MSVLMLMLFACQDANDLGASEEPPPQDDASGMPYCEETVSPVSREDASLIGVAPSELLDALALAAPVTLLWEDGVADELGWSLVADETTLSFVESVAVYPDSGGPSPAIDVECSNYVSVDAVFSYRSGDGRLDETQSLTVAIYGPDSEYYQENLAVFGADLDLNGLGGTLEIENFVDLAAWDAVSVSVVGELSFGGGEVALEGALSAMGETTSGSLATAQRIDIALWGESLE